MRFKLSSRSIKQFSRMLMVCFFLVSLGCTSGQIKSQSGIGENVDPEKTIFCGSMQAFTVASLAIQRSLQNAWDQKMGPENNDNCAVSVSLDKDGVIIGYRVSTCDRPEVLPEVIKLASPVSIPKGECLFKMVQAGRYTLNGNVQNDLDRSLVKAIKERINSQSIQD